MDTADPGSYTTGMRNPTRTVLILAMMLPVQTEMNAADMPSALTWPEIGDPAAVVRVAREIIAREVAKKPTLSDHFGVRVEEPRFAFPGAIEVLVGRKDVWILLFDIPFTGRGFLILADAAQPPPAGHVPWHFAPVQIQETATPEIKRVLLNLPTEWIPPVRGGASVGMSGFKHIDEKKASGPNGAKLSVIVAWS